MTGKEGWEMPLIYLVRNAAGSKKTWLKFLFFFPIVPEILLLQIFLKYHIILRLYHQPLLNRVSNTLNPQHHIMECVPARLHGQTCRWQMASREIHGESNPLAELTLKVPGRLESWSKPTVPCRESESWTSSLHGLWKFNYSLMKSELTSLHRHPHLPHPSLLSPSRSSSFTVAGHVGRSNWFHWDRGRFCPQNIRVSWHNRVCVRGNPALLCYFCPSKAPSSFPLFSSSFTEQHGRVEG